ncbi:hypothetical protein ACV1D9_19465 [Aeromonas allosaccharophila]
MANLQETASWDAGIYQIETTDPVLGGANGIANSQAKALANRTLFLKQQIEQLNSGQSTPSWIASQSYVQGELQKLDAKQSVRAATVANITLSGAQTIDGVVLTVGDRVLVKDQTASAQNGIYLVAAQSWTRATDADNGTKLSSGARVAVEEGTVNAGKMWYLATAGAITIGTTALLFSDEHRDATESVKGIVRLATNDEVDAASLGDVVVTPDKLNKHYRRGNILGIVSQSGGIPTGAIIEHGSNANGEYTKFADGTMIIKIPYTGLAGNFVNNTFDPPAAFVGAAYVGCSATPSTNTHKLILAWSESGKFMLRIEVDSTESGVILAVCRWM